MLAIIGWSHGSESEQLLLATVRGLAFGYGLAAVVEVAFAASPIAFLRRHWPAVTVAILVLVAAVWEVALSSYLVERWGGMTVRNWLVLIVLFQQGLALASRIGASVPWIEKHLFSKIHPGLFLAGAFAFLSVFGGLLLMMPNATHDGIGFLDALFTSTSAVCVTGLIVVDTGSYFTTIGQAIILVLIQVGGLGIVTITFFIAVMSGQGVTISSSVFLRDLLSTDTLGRLRSALVFIIVTTFGLEALGALLIYVDWDAANVGGDLEWLAVFHSISAFCNAGFSLFSSGLADTSVATDRSSQMTIMALIVVGGIGFPVLRELWWKSLDLVGQKPKWAPLPKRGFSVHTKVVLTSTAILLVAGTILFVVANRLTHEGSFAEAVWLSAFRSVSARTAGFNIGDIGGMSHGAALLMMMLMFVGGSPGGVAGGVKTTTISIAFLNLIRILRRKKTVTLFSRRVDDVISNRTFAVVLFSLVWILNANVAIMLIQPNLGFLDSLFEVVSAFATVGLSRGITSELAPASKMVIIATMFVGRIGLLNLFLSLVPAVREDRLKYPSGNVLVE